MSNGHDFALLSGKDPESGRIGLETNGSDGGFAAAHIYPPSPTVTPPAAIFSVDVDAFLISCLNNPKDQAFVLAVDDQLARLAVSLPPSQLDLGHTGSSLPPDRLDEATAGPLPTRPLDLFSVDFPPLSSYHRRIVHRVAEHYGLAHRVFDLDPTNPTALLPAPTTSKYRHIQVMHHPNALPRAPNALLRLRDLVSISPAADLSTSSPEFPSRVASSSMQVPYTLAKISAQTQIRRPAAILLQQQQPQFSIASKSSPLDSSSPAFVPTSASVSNPVRLLQRKVEPKAARAPPSPSPPPVLLPVSGVENLNIGAPGAQVESEASVSSENAARGADAAGEPFFGADEEDDIIDERLRSQLKLREEEYARARARIFGNSEVADPEQCSHQPQQ